LNRSWLCLRRLRALLLTVVVVVVVVVVLVQPQ
jgi:hypothetical protein